MPQHNFQKIAASLAGLPNGRHRRPWVATSGLPNCGNMLNCSAQTASPNVSEQTRSMAKTPRTVGIPECHFDQHCRMKTLRSTPPKLPLQNCSRPTGRAWTDMPERCGPSTAAEPLTVPPEDKPPQAPPGLADSMFGCPRSPNWTNGRVARAFAA